MSSDEYAKTLKAANLSWDFSELPDPQKQLKDHINSVNENLRQLVDSGIDWNIRRHAMVYMDVSGVTDPAERERYAQSCVDNPKFRRHFTPKRYPTIEDLLSCPMEH